MSSKGSFALAIAVATVAGSTLAVKADITGFGGFATVNQFQNGAPSTNAAIGYSGDGSTFQITTAANGENTSGYNSTAQNITSFTASFDYKSVPGASDGNGTLAANGIGLNFLGLNNGTATFAGVGNADGLGVTGITNSASLLFNNFGGYYNYQGSLLFETGGNVPGPTTYTANPWKSLPGPGLAAGDTMHVTTNYANGIVRINVLDTATGATFKTAYNDVDIAGTVGGTTALVGFSGTTGGFNSDQKVSNFQFTAGTATTGGYVKRVVAPIGTFTPVALAGGLNQATVVPAAATSASDGLNYINATLDNGTFITASAGSGATYYETGLAGATAGSGLPTSGSTFTSQADTRHTFKMPTYGDAANHPVNDGLVLYSASRDINSVGNTVGLLSFSAPTAMTSLSLLTAAGNGPADIGVIIHYTDGSSLDLGDVASPDWYGQTNPAWNANGRVDPYNGTFDANAPFGLAQVDVALPISAKTIAGVELSLDGASDTPTVAVVYGVSGLAAPVYALAGSGDAASAGSWVNGIPNAVDAVANFGSSITANSTVSVNGSQTVGALAFENAAASYTLGGTGSLTLDVSTGSAYIYSITGSHSVNVPLTLADSTVVTTYNNSSLTLGGPIALATGATLSTSGTIAINGTITGGASSAVTVAAGTTTFGASQNVPALTISDGAKAVIKDVPTLSVFRTSSLTIGTGSKLDLGDNGLAIDYTGASPLAAVVNQITSGAIISSKVAANASYGIGYAESSAVANPFGSPAPDATAVLVRVTLLGDADLSGKVEFADLLRLAKSYNSTGKYWSDGDFNYDGGVNFTDLLALAKNYNQSVSADQAAELPAGFAGDFALAQALAPEPTLMLSSLSVAALAMGRRRRGIAARA